MARRPQPRGNRSTLAEAGPRLEAALRLIRRLPTGRSSGVLEGRAADGRTRLLSTHRARLSTTSPRGVAPRGDARQRVRQLGQGAALLGTELPREHGHEGHRLDAASAHADREVLLVRERGPQVRCLLRSQPCLGADARVGAHQTGGGRVGHMGTLARWRKKRRNLLDRGHGENLRRQWLVESVRVRQSSWLAEPYPGH